MRILRILLVSFISHARYGSKKIDEYEIPDGAQHKGLASHTARW